MRDVTADYRRAYIEEYESYRRAGRTDDAEHIAGILRDHYDYEVAGEPEPKKEPEKERADEEHPPENTAEPKPARQPKKPAAKKPPAGE